MPKRKAVESISVRIMILEVGEADESILQELFNLLAARAEIQVVELPKKTEDEEHSKREVLSFSDLEIHIKEQAVYKNSELVRMSHYEFFTLCFLARHPGWVFTKQQIYEAVWQEPEGDGSAAITNVISQIRKKLHPDTPKDGYIKTVVNSGYKFEP